MSWSGWASRPARMSENSSRRSASRALQAGFGPERRRANGCNRGRVGSPMPSGRARQSPDRDAVRYNARILKLEEFLRFMASKEASDLHLKPMRPPLLRIKGKLVPLKSEALQPKELEDMLLEILTPSQRQKLEEHQSVDIGFGLTGVARFRANVYVQRGSLAAVFRRIP